MSLELGNVFLRPSSLFTLRHMDLRKKRKYNCLAEWRLTIYCLRYGHLGADALVLMSERRSIAY